MPVINFDELREQSLRNGGFQEPRNYSELNRLSMYFHEAAENLSANEETKALAEELRDWNQTIEYARSPEITNTNNEQA